jgi:hypothetical protein
MPDFIEVIPIGDKRYYFSFRKNEADTGVKVFVVTLEENDTISFEMKEHEKGVWKINSSAPEWIKRVETKISEAISIRQELHI